MTEIEALAFLGNQNRCKLGFPFEIQTKYGPRLLMKGTLEPETAAALLPHEPAYRKKGYVIKQDEKTGAWQVALFIRLTYLDQKPTK